MRAAIAEEKVQDTAGEPIPVTASVGLAVYEPGESLDSLVDRADRAMYAAKSGDATASPWSRSPTAPSPPLNQSLRLPGRRRRSTERTQSARRSSRRSTAPRQALVPVAVARPNSMGGRNVS